MAPLAALLIWWLAATQLAPLSRLAGELRGRDAAVARAARDRRLPDELAPLADSLNALLERLRQSLDAQRAFVADAAHELRSPLTALKLQLELLRRPARDADLEAARAGIGEASSGRAGSSSSCWRWRAASRRARRRCSERVDLAEVARRMVAETVPFARRARIEFELAAPAPAFVDGDPVALALLVRNLVDNAARYSPPGSRVEVASAAEGDASYPPRRRRRPGIPEAERQRVFDRFYRRAEGGESGSGLGLAIVAARRHRARRDGRARPLAAGRAARGRPLPGRPGAPAAPP
jgi:two-component system OmpR family sensor kinase/two-component system sensor histidine kinase QseC